MTKAKLYNQKGESVGTVDLDQKVFGLKPKRGVIEQVIVAIQANRRSAIAHTKTRGDVRGGGRKPWRQKGTGRARHGSIRSPQWKGGGVVHGPKSNRNFTLKINASTRRTALRMALSDKVQSERVIVLDALTLPEAKTKLFAAVIKALPKQSSTLFVLPTTNHDLIKAGRNIPRIAFIRANSLNVYDVVKYQQLVILQDALPVISSTYVK